MKFTNKLTIEKLCTEYLQWVDGKHTLRFGQHICNSFLKKDTSFPELFYETNPVEAFHLILKEI